MEDDVAIIFRVKRREDGKWEPLHQELASMMAETSADQTMGAARTNLFNLIESIFPGEYTLEGLPPEDARVEAFKLIDERSKQLIRQGFEYDGLVFSLSLEAQIRYTALFAKPEAFVYPLRVNALDDADHRVLDDVADANAFVSAALMRIREVVDSGSDQKDAVRAMTDVDEILNYTDPRPLT